MPPLDLVHSRSDVLSASNIDGETALTPLAEPTRQSFCGLYFALSIADVSSQSRCLKEVDKHRYTAKQVVALMNAERYLRFNQQSHTNLWKALEAKDPAKGFGRAGDYKNTWVWYDVWIDRVRAHCQEQADRYK